MKILGLLKGLVKLGFNVFWGIVLPMGIITTYLRLKELNSPESRALARNLGYELNTGYPTVILVLMVVLFVGILIFKLLKRKIYK